MTSTLPTMLSIHPAAERDRPSLEPLWAMFQHDMSPYTGALPDDTGRFRQERLDAALSDPDWCAYILRLGPAAVGLAVIRGVGGPVRTINSFFLVHAARRRGHGLAAVRAITRAHPGKWQVAFQDENAPAASFWPRAASQADDNWTLEHRAVPGRPDLPPDAWISFTVNDGSPSFAGPA